MYKCQNNCYYTALTSMYNIVNNPNYKKYSSPVIEKRYIEKYPSQKAVESYIYKCKFSKLLCPNSRDWSHADDDDLGGTVRPGCQPNKFWKIFFQKRNFNNFVLTAARLSGIVYISIVNTLAKNIIQILFYYLYISSLREIVWTRHNRSFCIGSLNWCCVESR